MHCVPLHFRLAHLFVTWLFLLLYIGPVFAQSTLSASPDADVSDVDAQVFPDTPTIPTTIAVGVYESPPFVIIDKEARVRGLAIDIWERIADERGWAFDYHHYTRDELLDATTQGEADVVVGAIGATGALAESVDLSHPMLSTGLGVAVREDPNTLKTR